MTNVKWTLRWATIAVLGTAFVASLDVMRKSFIPSRTGRWQDVVLDTCAGIGAQMLVFLWCMWRRNSDENRGSIHSISD